MPNSKSKHPEYLDYLGDIANRGRTMLLPALLKAQKSFGFISQEIASEIGSALRIPLADITGVIEFYSMLYPEPVGDRIIRVCTSPTCSAKGSHKLYQEMVDHPPQNGTNHIEKVECLGLCDQPPAVLVDETAIGQATSQQIIAPIDNYRTLIYGEERIITQRIGKVNPDSIEDYLAHDGFIGLRNALDIETDYICDFMENSGLFGRGGAAFVTRRKWEGAASADGDPKYIVCNGDESEPGTFKDRVLLENDPFAILEGMLIAGFAIGAEKGFVYIRGEYPRAQKIFNQIITVAKENGYLGKNILGSDFSFDVELRSGAGAYICGEETALFESIEGKRGFPRLKPPYPTTHGLFQKPTVINNVETFANVTLMLRIGVEKYCEYGTQQSSGPWLFCVSGAVEKPGLYEITSPVTFRELLATAGGLNGDCKLCCWVVRRVNSCIPINWICA